MVVNLTIPGGFSPNGDSKNQYFEIPELMFMDASLKVWNRWGDVVYQNENYKNSWDGICETSFCLGKGPLPEGTYFYQIDVQGVINKGHLTLKR
jgi:gliding motility-associated-like protein